MQVRAHGDAEPRARVDVDVRVDAALADQAQVGQALEERRAYLGPLADQNERVESLQPSGEGVGVLDVVREHRHLVGLESLEARQRPQRVEPIVEDRDLHWCSDHAGAAAPTSSAAASWSRESSRSLRRRS